VGEFAEMLAEMQMAGIWLETTLSKTKPKVQQLYWSGKKGQLRII